MDPVLWDSSNCQPVVPNSPEQKLARAIRSDEGLERVRSLVEGEGADISCRCLCEGAWTPLTLAAYLGKADVVAYLLCCIRKALEDRKLQYRWRVTVDSHNENGFSPLYCAALRGHVDVCRQLIEAGADVNNQNEYGKETPLLGAVAEQKSEFVRLLLEHGADVQLADNVGITPLYAAVENNSCDVVRQLIEVGCDVNVGSQDHAPVFLAARKGYLSLVQMLCEAGCYKDIANKYGVTPLYEAVLKSRNEVVTYLLGSGCDLDRCDMYKVTPLQIAVMANNLEGVKLLVSGGACLKWRNAQGKCAVQIAVETDKHTILEFFLGAGVDVTKRPNLAFTRPGCVSPLRAALEKSAVHPKTALLLLKGCPHLDLGWLRVRGAFGSQPALLELAFASGLSHPPSQLLTSKNTNKFSAECQRWLDHHRRTPQTLKKLARCSIRSALGNTVFHKALSLPLPTLLIDYVLFANAVIQEF